MSKVPYPRHGTRARSRSLGCTCVACSRRSGAVGDDYELTWPFVALSRAFTTEHLLLWFSQDQIDQWRIDGLTDEEADRVAVRLGVLPFMVWPGYTEAGLDYTEPVNRASV